ncbi:hypothetical protein [Sphingobacterium siyangense]|uniref:DUF4168 domain-containing protein n=1 Tax=Sphingobacterium siyangense TaxID=459529 RepID=A0A562MGX6_9SPHI|nr:hypothetical protein [Sphingobacterium siyangense]TWI19154.1 hypothetical protein IQ31_02900 [Sphingobacterium siyangense]
MKTLKITYKSLQVIMFFIIMLAGSQFANAQNAGSLKNVTPEQLGQAQTIMMKTKLNLDSIQVKSIEKINLNYAGKLINLRNNGGRPLAKAREAMSLEQQKDKEVKGVLNPTQYSQYQQMREENKQNALNYMSSH